MEKFINFIAKKIDFPSPPIYFMEKFINFIAKEINFVTSRIDFVTKFTDCFVFPIIFVARVIGYPTYIISTEGRDFVGAKSFPRQKISPFGRDDTCSI